MTYGAEPKDRPTPGRLPGRRRPVRLVAVVALAGLAIGAAACSSSKGGTSTTVKSTTTTINAAAAASAVTTTFQTVFDLANPDMTPKIAAIQDGSAIATSFQQAFTSSLASSASSAKIDSTKLLSKAACTTAKVTYPCDYVVYDIDNSTGTAVLPGSKGYAVYQNGQWLMAKVTICGLLGLFAQAEGNTATPAGC